MASACTRCHRPLKDPISVAVGMEPVCRGKATREESDEKMLRSSYTIRVQDGVIFLVVLNKGESVTNDAENVIADLARQGLLVGRRVLYRDTEGRWDELKHYGQRFTGFAPITTMAEALNEPAAFVDSMEIEPAPESLRGSCASRSVEKVVKEATFEYPR